MANKNDIRVDLDMLHPWLVYKLKRLITKCNEQGIYLLITEGYRTKEYQDSLYAIGRTKELNRVPVTNARGCDYASQHQWGVAFDIAIANDGHTWDTAYFNKVATIAKSKAIGLKWGGDWKNPIDRPHFYLGKWGATPDPLKKQYGTYENFKKTWKSRVVGQVDIKTKSKLKTKGKIPHNKVVKVYFRHLIWSKVEYNGVVGYIRTKQLKSK